LSGGEFLDSGATRANTRESCGGDAVSRLRIEVTSAGSVLARARRDVVRRRVLLALSRFERDICDDELLRSVGRYGWNAVVP